jgi:hypothetical protein
MNGIFQTDYQTKRMPPAESEEERVREGRVVT